MYLILAAAIRINGILGKIPKIPSPRAFQTVLDNAPERKPAYSHPVGIPVHFTLPFSYLRQPKPKSINKKSTPTPPD
jgi:hypothetical protein